MKKEKKRFVDIPVFNVITNVANIVLLNIVFLLCCIPIITIGVSITSMYAVARKLNDKDTQIFKTFFLAFKENFKKSTIAWLIMLIPIALLLVEASLLLQVSIEVPTILYVCLLIPATFLAVYLTWLFIEPAYFISTVKQQFKNAFLLMLKLIPQSLLILLFVLMPVILFLIDFSKFLLVWPIWLFFYFSTSSFFISWAIRKPMESIGEANKPK